MKKEDLLKLENQLCFPIYACSREIIKAYYPLLKKLDLTYTQYLVMMALWEYGQLSVKELGEKLYLDSGTLTPVLKKLEQFGYIERRRSAEDERVVLAILTEKGQKLKQKAASVPEEMGCHLAESGVVLTPEEVTAMKAELYKILEGLR